MVFQGKIVRFHEVLFAEEDNNLRRPLIAP